MGEQIAVLHSVQDLLDATTHNTIIIPSDNHSLTAYLQHFLRNIMRTLQLADGQPATGSSALGNARMVRKALAWETLVGSLFVT